MKILVTGGAGYIGTAVCAALEERGHDAVAVDLRAPCRKIIRADIRDSGSILAILKDHGIDSVVHCAAMTSVSDSFDKPLEYASVNVGGTLAILEAATGYGVDSFVFASSAAVYGRQHRTTLPEDAALLPISPYGESKAISEKHVNQATKEFGMGSCILRLFNVAGSWAGAVDDASSGHVLPSIADCIRRGIQFSINGDDWPTEDGTCVRDYVHVRDVATAFALATERAASKEELGVLNIGSGNGTSVLELIAMVGRNGGTKLDCSIEGRRHGDPARLVASVSKAERVLGWGPSNSSLEEIVSSVLPSHRALSRCL